MMMEWSIEMTYNLIELYKERRILWDPKDKSYYLHNRREEAWEELGELLQTSVTDVKRKMNSLLASYRRERLKMKTSGKRVDDTSKWFAYLKLGFLNDRRGYWNRHKSLAVLSNCSATDCEPLAGVRPGKQHTFGGLISEMSDNNGDWTEDNIVQLIELIRDQPLLWDLEHEAHRNRKRRVVAFDKIASEMQISREEVERKWRVIQAQFRRQRQKMKKSDDNESHFSSWFGYQHMQFLVSEKNVAKDTKQTRKVSKNRSRDDCGVIPEVSMGDSSEDNTDAYSQIVIVPKDSKSPTKKTGPSVTKRKDNIERISRPTKTFRILQPAAASRNRERDDCDVYAEYVASEIRKLDHRVQLNVKHLINNIIFEAQMGMHDDIPTVNTQQTSSS